MLTALVLSLRHFYTENYFQKQAYAKKYSLEWKMWQLALDSPIFWELRWSFFSFGWSSYCYWLNSRLGNKGWSSSRCVYVFVCVCVCVCVWKRDEWDGARLQSQGGLGSICLSAGCQQSQWLIQPHQWGHSYLLLHETQKSTEHKDTPRDRLTTLCRCREHSVAVAKHRGNNKTLP